MGGFVKPTHQIHYALDWTEFQNSIIDKADLAFVITSVIYWLCHLQK